MRNTPSLPSPVEVPLCSMRSRVAVCETAAVTIWVRMSHPRPIVGMDERTSPKRGRPTLTEDASPISTCERGPTWATAPSSQRRCREPDYVRFRVDFNGDPSLSVRHLGGDR
jgi:hypothetical protein